MAEDTKTEGAGTTKVPAPPDPEAVKALEKAKEDELAKTKAQITELEKVLADQKAKGEISAASESTLQALLEEMREARKELAELKKLGAAPNVSDDKWAKWFPH